MNRRKVVLKKWAIVALLLALLTCVTTYDVHKAYSRPAEFYRLSLYTKAVWLKQVASCPPWWLLCRRYYVPLSS